MSWILHSGYPVTLQSTAIHQIRGGTISNGVQELLDAPSGSPDPDHVLVPSADFRISVQTTDVKTLLDKTGVLIGHKLTGTSNVAKVYFARQDNTQSGQLASGSNHTVATVNVGVAVPRTLTFSRTAPAAVSFDIIATWDGTNNPIVLAGSQALSPASFVHTGQYVIGKVEINGTAYPEVQGGTIDFGLNVVTESDAGKPYAGMYRIESRTPSITLNANSANILHTLAPLGAAIGGSYVDIYLALLGTDSVPGTANALRFRTMAGRVTAVSSSHGGAHRMWTDSVRITPRSDNTNAQIIYATGQTIS